MTSQPRHRRFSHVLTLAMVLVTGHAIADVIHIVDGELNMPGGTFGHVNLIGAERGFSLTGRVDIFGGIWRPASHLFHTGDLIDLGAFWGGGDAGDVATLDGITYPVAESIHAPWSSPLIEFGGFIIAPILDGSSSRVLEAPFILTGAFLHQETDAGPNGRETLLGEGIVSVTLAATQDGFGDPAWFVDSAIYEFSPVPEPASLVLLGSGVIALGVGTYRRRVKGRSR